MPITESYIDGLTRQVFIKDYILNGMFPCMSDVTRGIRSKKVPWSFNDRFEYRMFMATAQRGGSLNSQVFNNNAALLKPGELNYAIFRTSYGTIMNGLEADMTANLETESDKVAFNSKYAADLQGMRIDTANIFKNYMLGGRYGVVHRLTTRQINTVSTVFGGGTPAVGRPFTLSVPINVFHSGFNTGKYLIKTTSTRSDGTNDIAKSKLPWGPANVNEMYMIIDNQPKRLTLQAVPGSTPTEWLPGQFLEVEGNRAVASNAVTGAVTGAYKWNMDGTWGGTGQYDESSPARAGYTGAMEGLPDLFPWYIADPNDDGSFSGTLARAGMDIPFREQPNRLLYSTQQAGGFYIRQDKESIIDAILNALSITAATVPWAEIGVWMNPDTRLAIGYQEQDTVVAIRELAVAQPVIHQRGITATSYSIGSKVIPDVISDYNIPTDVIMIGPKTELSYNTWDQSYFKIEDFIREQWSTMEPEKISGTDVPDTFATSLDLSQRIIYGSPQMSDGKIGAGGFVHPKNVLPVAYQEMGALFTETPFSYTMINLRKEIVDVNINNDPLWTAEFP